MCRPLDDETGDFQWRYYWNACWCTFISMTTVGYGDFYPVTTLGKAAVVANCFWGNFLVSLIVVTLATYVEFSPQEARVRS